MAAVIEEDLGARAGTLIDALEREPIAAASIGQVYRGLLGGREIAVKVQYPGIAAALDSDLDNVASLVRTMSLALPAMDVAQTFSDVTTRLREECDYQHERRSQEAFRARWEGDAECHVPQTIGELCGTRVLVTELVQGESFHELVAGASQAEKNRVGRVLNRFVLRSLYVHGALNADPHPGNYLFMPDGRVAFIDYGCVQLFSRETIAAVVEVRHRVVGGERGEPLRDVLRASYGMPDLEDELWAFVEQYLEASFAPLIRPQPFRYDRAYTEGLMRMTLAGKLKFVRQVLRHGVQEAKQPGLVFLNRINFGMASILAMLEAEGEWRALMADIDEEGGWLAPEASST
jgi:predicted unusual protein kinase regulating ubiquinone biosynthesis (AarF/ABC1/UbiB family)